MGSGLNAGNIGAEIDVIKPALPAQLTLRFAIHFAFGISRSFITLLIIFCLCEVYTPQEFPIALAGLLTHAVVSAQAAERQKMKYLVTASEGPGWSTPEEALNVLEKGVLPTFDILLKLEAEKRIVAGGLPVGERKLIFILEASSNEEVPSPARYSLVGSAQVGSYPT